MPCLLFDGNKSFREGFQRLALFDENWVCDKSYESESWNFNDIISIVSRKEALKLATWENFAVFLREFINSFSISDNVKSIPSSPENFAHAIE